MMITVTLIVFRDVSFARATPRNRDLATARFLSGASLVVRAPSSPLPSPPPYPRNRFTACRHESSRSAFLSRLFFFFFFRRARSRAITVRTRSRFSRQPRDAGRSLDLARARSLADVTYERCFREITDTSYRRRCYARDHEIPLMCYSARRAFGSEVQRNPSVRASRRARQAEACISVYCDASSLPYIPSSFPSIARDLSL